MVGPAVRLHMVQDHVALRIDHNLTVICLRSGGLTSGVQVSRCDPGVATFTFLIADASGVVLVHRHSEPALEPPGISAGNGVPLLPSDVLRTLLENLRTGIAIVGEEPALHFRHRSDGGPALPNRYFC